MVAAEVNQNVRHEPEEVPPHRIAVGLGVQAGVTTLPAIVIGVVIVVRAAGEPDSYLAGAITAVLLTLFLNIAGSRQRRLAVLLQGKSLGDVDAFLRRFAQRAGWNEPSTERLASAGEETLVVLLQEHHDAETPLRLSVVARTQDHTTELEFVTSLEGENVEDHLAYLSEMPPVPDEREVSFRLLLHYASSVSHRKYHGVDIVTVRVESTR